MNMKLIAAVAVLATSAAPAAAIEFNWSFTGIGEGGAVDSSGTLTAADTMMTIAGRDAYQVVSIAGARNGVAITGLRSDFPRDYGGADNYLFATGTLFTYQGLSYGLADGSFVNIYDNGREVHDSRIGGFYGDATNGQFNFSAAGGVPEPVTWALLTVGFGMAGSAVRRRRIGSMPVYA